MVSGLFVIVRPQVRYDGRCVAYDSFESDLHYTDHGFAHAVTIAITAAALPSDQISLVGQSYFSPTAHHPPVSTGPVRRWLPSCRCMGQGRSVLLR